MKTNKVYQLEKSFRDTMSVLGVDDPFIRQLPAGSFIVTLPHPVQDTEYVISTWGSRDAPREFKDIGRAVNTALRVGAKSIHFDTPIPDEPDA